MIQEWAAAMAAFHAELQPIQKDKTAKQRLKRKDGGEYEVERQYLSLDGILDTVRPILAKHGLFVMQPLTGDGIATTIYHKSGQFQTTIFPMSASWEGSPMTNSIQNAGGSFTYLRRYALAAALSISADDDRDGADHAPKVQSKPSQKQQSTAPKATTTPDADPARIAFEKTKELLREINPSKEIALLILQGFFGVGESKEIPALPVTKINLGNTFLTTFQHEYSEHQLYCQQTKEPEDMEYIKKLIEDAIKVPF